MSKRSKYTQIGGEDIELPVGKFGSAKFERFNGMATKKLPAVQVYENREIRRVTENRHCRGFVSLGNHC
jgi:hypothetical protein